MKRQMILLWGRRRVGRTRLRDGFTDRFRRNAQDQGVILRTVEDIYA